MGCKRCSEDQVVSSGEVGMVEVNCRKFGVFAEGMTGKVEALCGIESRFCFQMYDDILFSCWIHVCVRF